MNTNSSQQKLTILIIMQLGLVFIFVLSCVAVILLQRHCYKPSTKLSPPSFQFQSLQRQYEQKGRLHTLLFAQGLSHGALHKPVLQHALANVTGFPTSIVVVGVEFGRDVLSFGRAGHYVAGFEPMRFFYDRLRSNIEKFHIANNVELHNVAVGATDSRGDVHIEYNDHHTANRGVDMVTLDTFTRGTGTGGKCNFSVMTVDIQGAENEVIRGSKRLLRECIKVLWFEVNACNDNRTMEMFNTLDEDFVMFDFVPIVKKNAHDNLDLRNRSNYVFDVDRPAEFSEYLHWLCRQKDTYANVQTDVLAVKRSFLPSAVQKLNGIGETVCSHPDSNCLLRSLLDTETLNGKQNDQHEMK